MFDFEKVVKCAWGGGWGGGGENFFGENGWPGQFFQMGKKLSCEVGYGMVWCR